VLALHACGNARGVDVCAAVTSSLRDALKTRVSAVEAVVLRFALSQKAFASLSTDDQLRLLNKNTPLVVQFVLGRCVAAGSAAEQSVWLFDSPQVENAGNAVMSNNINTVRFSLSN
jgi:hypothetical protein